MVDLPEPDLPTIEVITPDWSAPANLQAFTTARNHGFSQGQWSGLNFGGACGDEPSHVKQNRALLGKLLPGNPPWLRQVHGKTVATWQDACDPQFKADIGCAFGRCAKRFRYCVDYLMVRVDPGTRMTWPTTR